MLKIQNLKIISFALCTLSFTFGLVGCAQQETVVTTTTTTVATIATTTTTTVGSTTSTITTTTTSTTTTTTGGGGGGLPPMGGDLRVSLEAVFAQYNNSVPKDTLISYLEVVGEALTGNKGPAAHMISATYPSDGLSFEARGVDENGFIAEKLVEGIIKHASVPDAVVGSDNKIRLYFVDAHATRKMIGAVKTLTGDNVTPSNLWDLYNSSYFRDNNAFGIAEQTDSDGISFEVKALRIISLPDTLSVADPSIVLAGDGSYRLYFFCVPRSEIPEGGDIAEASTHYVGCATSEAGDGRTFYYEGIVYNRKGSGLTDPEVYRFGSNYKLFMQGSKIRVASSSDGGKSFSTAEVELSFVTPEGYAVGGPSVRIGEFGEGGNKIYRMYFSAQYGGSTNFTASASSEDGSSWTFNPLPKIGGRGSMAPAKLSTGSYRFYFHH